MFAVGKPFVRTAIYCLIAFLLATGCGPRHVGVESPNSATRTAHDDLSPWSMGNTQQGDGSSPPWQVTESRDDVALTEISSGPDGSVSESKEHSAVAASEIADADTPSLTDNLPASKPAPANDSGSDAPQGETPGTSGENGKQKPETGNPETSPKKTFDRSDVSLIGLKIGDSAKSVEERFGAPNNQFVMEDENDPITVYDYDHFSVGFTTALQLAFVEIVSADIDPGLNGLRLGQTADDAVNALGESDSDTSYVMTYIGKGAILKLDIDPIENKIQSIKMFATP